MTNMVEHRYSGPTEAALAQRLKLKNTCDGGTIECHQGVANFWKATGMKLSLRYPEDMMMSYVKSGTGSLLQ